MVSEQNKVDYFCFGVENDKQLKNLMRKWGITMFMDALMVGPANDFIWTYIQM